MTLMEPSRQEAPAKPAVSGPRIVNGLTVRPRKPDGVWLCALLLLPDIVALFVLVPIAMLWLSQYIDSKWFHPDR
jgi:hypothetical protein